MNEPIRNLCTPAAAKTCEVGWQMIIENQELRIESGVGGNKKLRIENSRPRIREDTLKYDTHEYCSFSLDPTRLTRAIGDDAADSPGRGWRELSTLYSKKDAVDLPHETLWPMKTVTPMNA